jgi:hypothetical protein
MVIIVKYTRRKNPELTVLRFKMVVLIPGKRRSWLSAVVKRTKIHP